MSIFLGLVISNFVYQAFAGMDWITAVERSFFQGVAVLLCYVAWGER